MNLPDLILYKLLIKISGVNWPEDQKNPPEDWSKPLTSNSFSPIQLVANISELSVSELLNKISKQRIDPKLVIALKLLSKITGANASKEKNIPPDWIKPLIPNSTFIPLIMVSNLLGLSANEMRQKIGKSVLQIPKDTEAATTSDDVDKAHIPWTRPLLPPSRTAEKLKFSNLQEQLRPIILSYVYQHPEAGYEELSEEIWNNHRQLFSDFGHSKKGPHRPYLMQYLIRICLEDELCALARVLVEESQDKGIKYLDVINAIRGFNEFKILVKVWPLYANIRFLRGMLKKCFKDVNYQTSGTTASLRWYAKLPETPKLSMPEPTPTQSEVMPLETPIMEAPPEVQDIIANLPADDAKLKDEAKFLIEFWQGAHDTPEPEFTQYANFNEFVIAYNKNALDSALDASKKIENFIFENPYFLNEEDYEWYSALYDYYLKHQAPVSKEDLESLSKRFETDIHHICKTLETLKISLEACTQLPILETPEKPETRRQYHITRTALPKDSKDRLIYTLGGEEGKNVPPGLSSNIKIRHFERPDDIPANISDKPDLIIEFRKFWHYGGIDLQEKFNAEAENFRRGLIRRYGVKDITKLDSAILQKYLYHIRDVPKVSGHGWSEARNEAEKSLGQWDLQWFIDIVKRKKKPLRRFYAR